MDDSTTNSEKFKNILEVVAYLKNEGWKISKSAVYQHRDQGKIRPQSDSGYLVKDVERYAWDWLKRADGSGRQSKVEPIGQSDKREAEARKVSAQAEHWEIKTKILSGEYVERVAFERGLARRATVFKNDIENFIRNNAGEMIALVAGDATRAPDLIEFWLDESEKWLHRYSEDREFELPPSSANLSKLENSV